MIPKLRNQHRYTWMVLAVVLPIGFLAAWFAVPTTPTLQEIKGGNTEAYPQVVAQQEHELLHATLRSNDSQECQLELTLQQPLTLPFVRVYLHKQPAFNPRNAQELGLLGEKATYQFFLDSIPSMPVSLTVYDPIKKVPLITLPLS